MALSILDGNQSATTLSTILTSGQHITAHTVVSLGTQAITDMRGAVSGSVVSISNFPPTQTIAGSVTANLSSTNLNAVTIGIRGTVTANNFTKQNIIVSGISDNYGNPSGQYEYIGDYKWSKVGWNTGDNAGIQYDIFKTDGEWNLYINSSAPPEAYTVSTAPLGENWAYPPPTGWSAASSGTFFIFSGTPVVEVAPLAISGTVTVGNSITIGSLPAISGTVTVGAVSTTVTIAHHQGTSVTTSNFTSTTASTTLASANASREVLTIFNEGAGNLHICAGATCTTIAYQVRLSAGDYYEVPLNQTSLTHSAVFATAGTARVTQIS